VVDERLVAATATVARSNSRWPRPCNGNGIERFSLTGDAPVAVTSKATAP
jgi:hypothetical protein